MKKILSIIVLSLLFCNTSFAKIIDLSCVGFKSYKDGEVDSAFEDYSHIRIDTNKKIMTELSDDGSFSYEWILTEINERYYFSDKYTDMDEKNSPHIIYATLNRFTGLFYSQRTSDGGRYFYHCSTTKQLF